jgi:quercetin dioxygenase-like cupin family protein
MGNVEDYIVKTSSFEWQHLIEQGVNTNGIFIMPLRYNEERRPPSFLLKFGAGSSYPYHNHPAGEELFVLEGSCFVNETKLEKGDYLYTPPNAKHSVRSETGCTILFIVPQEVQIIRED